MEEELVRRIILAVLIACLAVGAAAAQSCDSKAVSANGKPSASGKLAEAKQ